MPREVTIRMYRQGLGDCFLLRFPREGRPCYVLIDCGAIVSRRYRPESIQKFVEEIRETTGGRLDVVAATHEHWDHISGFTDARNQFDEIEVNAVWVAWTEDPESEAAKALKKEFKKAKAAIANAVARMRASHDAGQLRLAGAVEDLLDFAGGLAAAKSTSDAWQYILAKGPNVYCNARKPPLELDGVEDVRVFILGPPEDPDRVRQLLSKKETYDEGHPSFAPFAGFVGATADDPENNDRSAPFAPRYRVPASEARSSAFFGAMYYAETEAWRSIESDWLGLTGELALHLDSYTNNTCLAFAIELGEDGPVLLFPGDAQVGNWLSWQDRRWKVKTRSGAYRNVTGGDLLARTVLYKVGHHGSHNATMRAKGLEMMDSPELVAMIPVHRQTASDKRWQFPYPPLWKRLKEKARARVLLADASDLDEIEKDLSNALSSHELSRFKKAVVHNDMYVEYTVAY